tara:strand:- start:1458 stop:1859 length:402 start_codon:yes stop_codon:yes gene_type:complete
MKSFNELRQDVPRSELSEADIAAMVRRSKKAARRMKILAKKSSTKFKRQLAKKKVMPLKKLKKYAAKAVRKFLAKKIVGKQKDLSAMNPSQKAQLKIKVDKRINKMKNVFNKLVKKNVRLLRKKRMAAKMGKK